jgi:hypothetical protein
LSQRGSSVLVPSAASPNQAAPVGIADRGRIPPPFAISTIFKTMESVAGLSALQSSWSTLHIFRNADRIASMCAGSPWYFAKGMAGPQAGTVYHFTRVARLGVCNIEQTSLLTAFNARVGTVFADSI